MLAYGYEIKYNKVLEKYKKNENLPLCSMRVTETSFPNIEEKFKYKLTFHNNQGRDLALYSDKIFASTKKGQLWVFDVKGVVTFYWYSGRLALEYVKQENFSEKLLKYWSLHIALPLFFTIEEMYDFLHAGAVEVEGKPILFVAESFGGKSTMTDFFLKQGHTMISDDKVATYEEDDIFYAVPSHPHHRPHRGMEDLGFFVENVAKEPKPIHAIYELDRAASDAPVTITELQGIEKFKSLRYSSEINLSFLKTKRFVFLSRLAKTVPVYKVTVPWDMERLPEVYDTVIKHSTR